MINEWAAGYKAFDLIDQLLILSNDIYSRRPCSFLPCAFHHSTLLPACSQTPDSIVSLDQSHPSRVSSSQHSQPSLTSSERTFECLLAQSDQAFFCRTKHRASNIEHRSSSDRILYHQDPSCTTAASRIKFNKSRAPPFLPP